MARTRTHVYRRAIYTVFMTVRETAGDLVTQCPLRGGHIVGHIYHVVGQSNVRLPSVRFRRSAQKVRIN